MYIWSTLQLPVPPNIEKIALEAGPAESHPQIYQSRTVDLWEKSAPEYTQRTGIEITRYMRYPLPMTWRSWLREQIPEFETIGLNVSYQVVDNHLGGVLGAIVPPHTDGERSGCRCKHVLQYLIDTGGHGVKTRWWQQNHQPLIRERMVTLGEDKTLIAETVFETGTWSLFRADIIHSVEMITGARRAFSIGFGDEKLFFKLIKRLGIDNFSHKNYDILASR
jgi:hypothetical protein